MLDLCREAPCNAIPHEAWTAEAAYADWLPSTTFPTLFANAEPGAFLTGDTRAFGRSWQNQEDVTVPGMHLLREDSPAKIAAALAAWFDRL
jgi:haloalkane dehalogenase